MFLAGGERLDLVFNLISYSTPSLGVLRPFIVIIKITRSVGNPVIYCFINI